MKMPDLSKQVGPLPLGAWLIVVAGGLGVAWYTQRNKGSQDPVYEEDTSGVPGVGAGGGGFTDVQPPATGGDTDKDYATNEEWGRAAINWLIAKGYDPNVADSGIRHYLMSEKPTLQEAALIALVLVALGAPPMVLPPAPAPDKPVPPKPPIVTPPKPKPKPPAKPKVRYYTVKKGDNLWNISVKYYGRPDWGRIFNANKKGVKRADGSTGMIVSSNLIQPGWKLIIP